MTSVHPQGRNFHSRRFSPTLSGLALFTILFTLTTSSVQAQMPTPTASSQRKGRANAPTEPVSDAYVFFGSDNFGTMDLSTGTFTQSGSTGSLLAGIGVGPGGSLYGGAFESNTFYQINLQNGNLTTIGTSGIDYYELASTLDGALFGFDQDLNLYSVDPTTASVTLIGSTGLSLPSPFVIGTSTGTSTLYFTMCKTNSNSTLYSIDTGTGAATEIGSTGVPNLGALVFENGALYAGSATSPSSSIYTLDSSTGQATLVTTTTSGAFWGLAAYGVTATVTPASLSFGDQAVNTVSAAKKVTLKNTGTVTIDISSITPSADFEISTNTCGTTLAVGKTCKAGVTFTPTQVGAATGTLTFSDNASSSPQTVALSGTGEAQATLTPSSYTFPKTKVGKTSAAHSFTLKNNLPTTLTGVAFSTAAPFAVSTSTCGTTLDSKKSCTISVTFSPTSEETFTGTLTVNDSANDSPQTSSLSGTGD